MIKKEDKLGQTTTFIIIGLILIIAIFGIIYITGLMTKDSLFDAGSSDPIVVYTEECLSNIAEQGLVRLGQQGGYIFLDEYPVETSELDPFNSPVLKIGDYQAAPYWFYQKHAGLDRTEMPTLEKTSPGDDSVQDQLERYIIQELPLCLDDYSTFKEQGLTIFATEEPDPTVIFTDENVVVTMYYPLSINTGEISEEGETDEQDASKTLDSFGIDINVDFRNVYGFAKDIASYEQKTAFIEQNTMNLITMFSRVNSDYLPPLFGGMQVEDCGDLTYWMEDDVNDYFKQMLNLNMPYLKIRDTDFERLVVSKNDESDDEKRETMQGIFDMMSKNIEGVSQPDINVLFEYRPGFPLELDLGQRGMIKPTTQVDFNYLFGRKCVFVYKYAYSYKFPVLTTLIDSSSKIDNQPYVFQFPLMAVTKSNFPRVSLSDVFGLEGPEKESYLCDADQRVSAESVVNAIDSVSSQPIADAMVSFQCGPAFVDEYDENGSLVNSTPFSSKCFIGKTDASGKLTGKFPQCIGGGIVLTEKQGYSQEAILIGDVVQDNSFTTLLEMTPLTKLKVDVKKYYVIPPLEDDEIMQAKLASIEPKQGIVLDDQGSVAECNLYTPPGPFDSNEEAIITMRKVDPTLSPSNPYTFIFYNPNNESSIDVGPGTYQVDILFVRNEKYGGELDIEQDSEKIHIEGTLFKKGEDIYYPEETIEVESIMNGGAVYITSLNEEDLGNGDTITFYVFDEGTPQKMDQYFGALGHRESCSGINYNEIKPIITKEG
jgi:hypothetical protein